MRVCLFTVAVDEAAVHAKESVSPEERHTFVAVNKRMVHRETLHQRGGLFNNPAVVSDLGPSNSRFQSPLIADAMSAAKLVDEVGMEGN